MAAAGRAGVVAALGSTLGRSPATGKIRFQRAIVVRFGAQGSPTGSGQKVPFRAQLEVPWPTSRAAPGRRMPGYLRIAADQRWLQTVIRFWARHRAKRRIGMPIEVIGICEPLCAEHPVTALPRRPRGPHGRTPPDGPQKWIAYLIITTLLS